MTWKSAGVVVAIISLCVWGGLSVSATVPATQTHGRDSYRRPPAIPYPSNNPNSEAKLKLGRMLFFDPLLSGSRMRSCASCHNPALSWGDGRARALGEGQKMLPLRSPPLLGVASMPVLPSDSN